MTPTHKDLVEALREAQLTLDFYTYGQNIAVDDTDADGNPLGFYLLKEFNKIGYVDFGEKAKATLSKINPILKELEGE